MSLVRKIVLAMLPATLWIACPRRGFRRVVGPGLLAFGFACGDDGDIGPDAAQQDAQTDQSVSDVEAGGVHDEPYYECCAPPPPPIAPFQQQEATVLCARLQSCCGDAGIDAGACVAEVGLLGWQSSNRDLLTPGVISGGRLVFNQVAATSCLAGLATLSCPTVGSPEMKATTSNCFAAVSGTQGIGAACRADSECQTSEYCTTSGTCAALLGQDASCTRSGECAYKGGPSPPLFCDGVTCQPLRANDAGCANHDECASGICDSVNHACTTAVDTYSL